jgi:hypothetical protein
MHLSFENVIFLTLCPLDTSDMDHEEDRGRFGEEET